MIDAKFVEAIRDLAERGMKTERIQGSGNTSMLVAGGKVLATIDNDEPIGEILVDDFDSFIAAVHYLNIKATTVIITVTAEELVAKFDHNRPNMSATVRLTVRESAAFAALCCWEGAPKTVSAINKLFRTQLAGVVPDKVLPIFRQVEFASSGSVTVTKQTHRDTMGKSVDAAVKSSAGEIPETLECTLKLLLNVPNPPMVLRYFIDVHHDNQTIGITQIGDAVDAAMREVVKSLVWTLSSDFPTALVVAG